MAFISVGAFFLTSCVQRQCGCMSCLTPERRVAAKEGCSALTSKIRADAGGLEIFYAKAGRISLSHTLPYGKRLIPAHLLSVRLDSNGFPGLKARENINGPPSCCDGNVKNISLRKEACADPAKKKCAAMIWICKTISLRHCSLRWLLYKPRVAARPVNSGGASVRTTTIPGDASRNTDNSRSVFW